MINQDIPCDTFYSIDESEWTAYTQQELYNELKDIFPNSVDKYTKPQKESNISFEYQIWTRSKQS